MINHETRQALVTYVISSVGARRPIGKKAAQKFIHLIEDAAKVSTGYDFSIYTYGPFSRTLATEIDFLASKKAINVEFDQHLSSFEISPGENSQIIINRGSQYISENKLKIDNILTKLNGKSGRDLELYSTLVFLIAHVESLDSDDKIVDKLLSLKPKYQKEVVQKTLIEAKMLMAS